MMDIVERLQREYVRRGLACLQDAEIEIARLRAASGHPYPRERTWSDAEAEIERLRAENDRLIHDIQAPDGYPWEWHCARKDEEIERLRQETLVQSECIESLRALLREAIDKPFTLGRQSTIDAWQVDWSRRVREAIGNDQLPLP
jgi:hypothetical protein